MVELLQVYAGGPGTPVPFCRASLRIIIILDLVCLLWGWAHRVWLLPWELKSVGQFWGLENDFITERIYLECSSGEAHQICPARMLSWVVFFSRFSFQWQYLTIFLRASSICCKIFINEDCSFSRTRTGQFHIYDQTHLMWGHLISVTQFDEHSVLKSSCEASSMHKPMI